MARIARVVVPNYPHHVTQRGNRRQEVFFKEEDYETYLSHLSNTLNKTMAEVWAYCLMPNHVHLVMVPKSEDGLRATLGEAHRHYTRHVNFREGWRGHLWQERFHSFPMDENYLMATVRYVELNPVRAGLCDRAEQWRWSSAKAHFNAQDDSVVTVMPMLDRVSSWQDYLAIENGEMQDLIRRHQRTGRPLGDNDFVDEVERLTGRQIRPTKPGPKKAFSN